MPQNNNQPGTDRVVLPAGMVATKYPGYFWCTNTHRLMSLKSGILQPLKIIKPNYFNKASPEMGPYYAVSHRGERKFMSVRDLMELQPAYSVIPDIWPVTTAKAIEWHNLWFTFGNGSRLGQFLMAQVEGTYPEVFNERDNTAAWTKFCDKYVKD